MRSALDGRTARTSSVDAARLRATNMVKLHRKHGCVVEPGFPPCVHASCRPSGITPKGGASDFREPVSVRAGCRSVGRRRVLGTPGASRMLLSAARFARLPGVHRAVRSAALHLLESRARGVRGDAHRVSLGTRDLPREAVREVRRRGTSRIAARLVRKAAPVLRREALGVPTDAMRELRRRRTSCTDALAGPRAAMRKV